MKVTINSARALRFGGLLAATVFTCGCWFDAYPETLRVGAITGIVGLDSDSCRDGNDLVGRWTYQLGRFDVWTFECAKGSKGVSHACRRWLRGFKKTPI